MSNTPGKRSFSTAWTDASGKFWLFGGAFNDGTSESGAFNDLWKYDPSTNLWTWVKGDNTKTYYGRYGIQGIAAPANNPGAREGAVSWTDTSGNMWLFGGSGTGAVTTGTLNDLWKYNPLTNSWTWVKGDSTVNNYGVYGILGTAAAANKPGARKSAVSWMDASGNLWLFGGTGYAAVGTSGTTYLVSVFKLYNTILLRGRSNLKRMNITHYVDSIERGIIIV